MLKSASEKVKLVVGGGDGDGESASSRVFKLFAVVSSLAALVLSAYELVTHMNTFSETPYVILTSQESCTTECSEYDSLMTMPGDAIIINEESHSFRTMEITTDEASKECDAWPTELKHGCADGFGDWKLLSAELNKPEHHKGACEALCHEEADDGCCSLFEEMGCFWRSGSHATEIGNGISINCSNMEDQSSKTDTEVSWTCKNVDGETIQEDAKLYNPACLAQDLSACDDVYHFGPSNNAFRIGMIWASIIFVILFNFFGFVVSCVSTCGGPNLNMIAVEQLAEMGVPHPKKALGVIEFIFEGMLLTPAVLVLLFDVENESPCLAVMEGANFSFLLYVTNVFLITPFMIVGYAALAGSEEKTLKEREMAYKVMQFAMAIFVLLSTVTACYTAYIEAIGSWPLLVAHVLSAVAIFLNVEDPGCF